MRRWIGALVGVMAGIGLAQTAQAQASQAQADNTYNTLPHPGQAIYRSRCAACHDNAEATRAPTKATLGAMSYQVLSFALVQGKMKAQAAGLSEEERGQLINYLTGRSAKSTEAWSQAMMCTGARAAAPDLKPAPTVATFGFDARNTRTLTAAQTGLTKAKLGRLDLAWSVAFPDVTMIRAQGAVVGNTLFIPVAEASAMYAFDLSDAAHPCLKWVYNTPGGAPLRSSPGEDGQGAVDQERRQLFLLADHRHAARAEGPDHRAGQPVRDHAGRRQQGHLLHQPRLRPVAGAGHRQAAVAL